MKKPSVLNRSMFNRGGTSAYGKGITSNLVSDEQRQRYNYGGRVGYVDRGYVHGTIPGGGYGPAYSHLGQPVDPFHQRPELWYSPIESTTSRIKKKLFGTDTDEEQLYEKIYGEGSIHEMPEKLYESQTVPPYKVRVGSDIVEREFVEEPIDKKKIEEARDVGMTVDEMEAAEADVEDRVGKSTSRASLDRIQEQMKQDEDAKLLTGDTTGAAAGIADTDMLDIEGIIDKYYDKKTALGEGQLGLAGSVLAAGFEGDKKKAAAILGGGMGTFGKTLAGQAKERSKLGATLEGQREIYRQSRIAEGEQDRETARIKEEMLQNRPEKNSSLADQFKFFKTQTKDYGKAVKLTLGDKVISISDDIDITTMKKDPSKIYKIRIGGNDIYKMYDDNGQEIEDFNIEEYITKLS